MARRLRSIASFSTLWQRHEALYASIFIDALNVLQINDEQREDEDAISELLCINLKKSCYKFKEKSPLVPAWERPVAPSDETEIKGGKKRKRPDFTCSLINAQATSAAEYEIPLHIECKRLGIAASGWPLNENYVKNGISRFDTIEHEYGKRAISGIMIGYIINSHPRAIEVEVNSFIPKTVDKLAFDFLKKISCCNTRYNRSKVLPNDFKLLHIWVDLRT